jgi:bacterioferritin
MTATRIETAPSAFPSTRERRRRARVSIVEPRTLTQNHPGDRETVLRLLNEALATKLGCVLRYRRHHFTARGLASHRIAEEFLLHADEGLAHADLLAERIVQLGGEPDFSPAALQQHDHGEHLPVSSCVEMVRQNLTAERFAIDSYRTLVATIGENDPTTRRMLEAILAVEEAHADELMDLL